jgi:hypothetical protein
MPVDRSEIRGLAKDPWFICITLIALILIVIAFGFGGD